MNKRTISLLLAGYFVLIQTYFFATFLSMFADTSSTNLGPSLPGIILDVTALIAIGCAFAIANRPSRALLWIARVMSVIPVLIVLLQVFANMRSFFNGGFRVGFFTGMVFTTEALVALIGAVGGLLFIASLFGQKAPTQINSSMLR